MAVAVCICTYHPPYFLYLLTPLQPYKQGQAHDNNKKYLYISPILLFYTITAMHTRPSTWQQKYFNCYYYPCCSYLSDKRLVVEDGWLLFVQFCHLFLHEGFCICLLIYLLLVLILILFDDLTCFEQKTWQFKSLLPTFCAKHFQHLFKGKDCFLTQPCFFFSLPSRVRLDLFFFFFLGPPLEDSWSFNLGVKKQKHENKKQV